MGCMVNERVGHHMHFQLVGGPDSSCSAAFWCVSLLALHEPSRANNYPFIQDYQLLHTSRSMCKSRFMCKSRSKCNSRSMHETCMCDSMFKTRSSLQLTYNTICDDSKAGNALCNLGVSALMHADVCHVCQRAPIWVGHTGCLCKPV